MPTYYVECSITLCANSPQEAAREFAVWLDQNCKSAEYTVFGSDESKTIVDLEEVDPE